MNLPTKIIVSLIFLCALSCQEQTIDKTELLRNYLSSKNVVLDDFNSILVLTENNCPNCTRSFSTLLQKQISNSTSLLIISSKGNIVDISPFLDSENQANIIHDFKGEFESLEMSDGANAIFLNDNRLIDTIVQIRAKDLENTLSYIENRLGKN